MEEDIGSVQHSQEVLRSLSDARWPIRLQGIGLLSCFPFTEERKGQES